jgi:hypothetical protein
VTAPAMGSTPSHAPRPCDRHAGESTVCTWCLERLHDEIDLLRAAVEAIQAAWDAYRKGPSAEPAWGTVYARVEVAGDAVVRASSTLRGTPAAPKEDPLTQGGAHMSTGGCWGPPQAACPLRCCLGPDGWPGILDPDFSLHYDNGVTQAACAAAGCANPLPEQNRGRPARFCSTACRVRAHRQDHRDAARVVVEVDYGSTSSKGRPPGRAWLVRLRRDDEAVIVSIGLSFSAAERLAQKIAGLLKLTTRIPSNPAALSP